MAAPRKSPVQTFRKRLLQRGLVRVEVYVQKADAHLVRDVARAWVLRFSIPFSK